MIKVYHQTDDNFLFCPPTTQDAGEFTLVAEVDTEDLETAYKLTNTIDCYWWENEGVTPLVTNTRSSSMGDVFILNGRAYGVDIFGFKDLGPAA